MTHNRDSVIAIQGGGVLGFTLLGQLESVLNHGYVPLALAGTSGGAIVAALLWAGYSPSEIRRKLTEFAEDEKLPSFLGPCDPPPKPPFEYSDFAALVDSGAKGLSRLVPVDDAKPKGRWRNALLWAPRKIAMARTLAKLRRGLAPHFHSRGCFTGQRLEDTLDRWMREAIGMPKGTAPNEPLTFRHARELMIKRTSESRPGGAYRPPLLLTATNLSKKRLEIINSIEERYMNVPVAKAVRASAGFPVFFRPREIPECPSGGWFVDGGMVSNFPMWVFSDVFRQQISGSALYRVLASKPWIRIGLRVVDDVTNVPDLGDTVLFWKSFGAMLSGGSRNELESVLASRAPRSLQILQPRATTLAPESILDMGAMTPAKIHAMIDAGRDYADAELEKLQSPSIYNAAAGSAVRDSLEALIRRCLGATGLAEEDAKLRANVFLPLEDRLELTFQQGMDKDDDRDLQFPNQTTGLTGLCFVTRQPQVCNLEEVGRLRERRPDLRIFSMPIELQNKVRADRTWLASVPIFDPYELHYEAESAHRQAPDQVVVRSTHGVRTGLDGPLLGILNIDAGWQYGSIGLDPNPEVHYYSDERIQVILSLMQAAAFSIGELLTRSFPGARQQ